MSIKIVVFDAKPYDRISLDAANKEYGFELVYVQDKLNDHTVNLAKGFDAVSIFVNDKVDKKIATSLADNGVKVVALRCAGYNNIDLEAAYGSIHVVRVPEYSPYAVAEHAAGLMLCLNRKIHKAYHRVRDGNFSIDGFLGFDIHGKTVGVVGTGKIGRRFIAILKGFGADILAYDPYPDEDYAGKNGITYTSLEEIYEKADIISLHCPLNEDTRHLIDAEAIDKMKKHTILINTGRGALVDAKALIDGLKSGKVGGACLDVYEEESDYFFEDHSSTIISDDTLARLLTFPNVLVTSHQAFFTHEALHNIAVTTFDNIKEFFDGGYLKNEICYQCDKKCLKKENKRCFG